MVEDSLGEVLAPHSPPPEEQEQCCHLEPTRWPLSHLEARHPAAAGSPLESALAHSADTGAPSHPHEAKSGVYKTSSESLC